jgi:dipeptidyl aminopeptidase/acylaminoacyl peptidase
MVRGPIQSHADRVSPATPLNFVSSEAPPFLIVHDPRDQYVPYDQSERLHQALTAAGVESTLVTTHESEYPFHGFDDQGEGREAVREAVDAFFAKHLKPRPPW